MTNATADRRIIYPSSKNASGPAGFSRPLGKPIRHSTAPPINSCHPVMVMESPLEAAFLLSKAPAAEDSAASIIKPSP